MDCRGALTILLVAFVCAATMAPSAPAPTISSGSIALGAEMLSPRSGHTATLLPDGRVLIAGGMRRNQDFYRSAELFDPKTGKFSAAGGDMQLARVGHVAVLLRSGKVLIAGGWIGQGATDEAELYDPAAGKFTVIAPMTTKRGRPEATVLRDGNVLITGGADSGGAGTNITSAEVFDTASLKFRATGPMHQARIAHTSTLLTDGRVLIAGGRGSEVNATAEIYDPKSGAFTETGRMLAARYKHTAGLLPDGRVLIAGGSDERDWHGTLSSAEIYDPKRGTFTATDALHDARFKLPSESVQLRNGLLLVAGGNRQAEVFDGRAGKFAVVAGDTGDSRHFMSETLLSDGRVLLAGGYAYTPEATSQTWIYKP